MPRRPTGWNSRSICSSGSASTATSPAGTASASSCRPMASAAPSSSISHRSRPPQPAAASWCGWSRAPIGTAEIKRAQVDGLEGFPGLHPQDPHRRFLPRLRAQAAGGDRCGLPAVRHPQRPDAGRRSIQMAAEISRSAKYEFQCLHGMGEPLYDEVVGAASGPAMPHLRAGRHARDAAGLSGAPPAGKRRQLLLRQPHRRSRRSRSTTCWPIRSTSVRACRRSARRIDKIALPRDLFGAARANSRASISQRGRAARLAASCKAASTDVEWQCAARCWPTGAFRATASSEPCAIPPTNARPRRHRRRRDADRGRPAEACASGRRRWAGSARRARRLPAPARPTRWKAASPELMGPSCARPARRLANAVAEVREAVDFLRYYARQAPKASARRTSRSGPVACISPWNFPLAIFTGQVAAALAAGNPVLAKPAEETPLIAARPSSCCMRPACPPAALQLVPGRRRDGRRGAGRTRGVAGVMFTGSTEVARLIQAHPGRRSAAGKPIPLIAETGGQNAMIVDSSALPSRWWRRHRLGLRQRRPALLGAARAVPAGRHRRPHVCHAARARWQELSIGRRSPVGRCRPGHLGRGAEARHRRISSDARLGHAGRPQVPRCRRAAQGTFVAADDHRDRRALRPQARGVRPGAACLRYEREEIDRLIDASTPPATA
jgi:RHH-type proline utilization regulon transcriptional repressor/proline dehydrogenase/delta 1-pyrroline-5-carboxylate dehydrogenase